MRDSPLRYFAFFWASSQGFHLWKDFKIISAAFAAFAETSPNNQTVLLVRSVFFLCEVLTMFSSLVWPSNRSVLLANTVASLCYVTAFGPLSNHMLTKQCFLLILLVVLLWYRREKESAVSLKICKALEAVVPLQMIALYVVAAVHKLNDSWFDSTKSCASQVMAIVWSQYFSPSPADNSSSSSSSSTMTENPSLSPAARFFISYSPHAAVVSELLILPLFILWAREGSSSRPGGLSFGFFRKQAVLLVVMFHVYLAMPFPPASFYPFSICMLGISFFLQPREIAAFCDRLRSLFRLSSSAGTHWDFFGPCLVYALCTGLCSSLVVKGRRFYEYPAYDLFAYGLGWCFACGLLYVCAASFEVDRVAGVREAGSAGVRAEGKGMSSFQLERGTKFGEVAEGRGIETEGEGETSTVEPVEVDSCQSDATSLSPLSRPSGAARRRSQRILQLREQEGNRGDASSTKPPAAISFCSSQRSETCSVGEGAGAGDEGLQQKHREGRGPLLPGKKGGRELKAKSSYVQVKSGGEKERGDAFIRWLSWTACGLVWFWGLCPYLGIRTYPAFAMFSNLRVEGERPNHFIYRIVRPEWLRVMPFLSPEESVRVEATDIPKLRDFQIDLSPFYREDTREFLDRAGVEAALWICPPRWKAPRCAFGEGGERVSGGLTKSFECRSSSSSAQSDALRPFSLPALEVARAVRAAVESSASSSSSSSSSSAYSFSYSSHSNDEFEQSPQTPLFALKYRVGGAEGVLQEGLIFYNKEKRKFSIENFPNAVTRHLSFLSLLRNAQGAGDQNRGSEVGISMHVSSLWSVCKRTAVSVLDWFLSKLLVFRSFDDDDSPCRH
uniref:Uncharacterized protein n=1 Tax=Chromera velia CCMP2878 TaxID=1169474 RepID=A0A0G4HGF1_9ALVE|eukprot:Cvel_27192.t1-p1 / transcript=Cvel_27192.t1 / gene=Cvel_27192 / organism=Chromera_velia_CCMP2878 / gene_product=hypothetical protein / transcript_product=hypothetical protein / location=Cvel_scaffold3357:14536-17055(-) / protein_length=840 / sequence_SO=supercontig / SO=protein_coding / is_pseudo=false